MTDLIKFLREKGFDFEPTLTDKNQFVEFKTPTRKGWFAGSEIKRDDGPSIIVANFGDWKTGEKYTFVSDESGLSDKEKANLKKKIEAQTKLYQEEKRKKQETSAEIAQEEWRAVKDAHKPSPYLLKKNITKTFGCKTQVNSYGSVELIIPMRDTTGKLWGYQRIQEDSQKFFLPGQRTQGLFHQIGEINSDGIMYLTEGFATGATVHMATNKPVVCAFFANNLMEVGKAFREKYPDLTIVIAGDDDKFSDQGNAGREKATEVASQISATCLFPIFKKLDSKPTDFNDLQSLEGLAEVSLQIQQHEPIPPNQFIRTEHTGFHSEKMTRQGIIHVPEYEDLRRYFQKLHKYKVMTPGKTCYIWNGKYYKPLAEGEIDNFAHKHFRPVADNKKAAEFRGLVMRSEIKPPDWFNASTTKKVNFQNGYLDIATGSFHASDSQIGFRHVLDYNYDEKAECPNFNKMLKRITVEDSDLEKTILEFIGYAVSGDSYWIHKALILEGTGSNGKSTLLNVIRAVIGTDNCSSVSLQKLTEPYSCQLLDGKLANVAGETEIRALLESAPFKNLTGNETVTVRQIYKEPYNMKNKAKLIFSCNEMPETNDTSDALIRRCLLVPCNAKFTKEDPDFDPHIEEKVLGELPGIFNRVLTAYRELLERKFFTEGEASRIAVTEYKKDINPLIDWVSEKIEVYDLGNGHDNSFITFAQLYDEYVADMKRLGYEPYNAKALGHKLRVVMKDYLNRKGMVKINGGVHKIIKGVRLYSVKDQ